MLSKQASLNAIAQMVVQQLQQRMSPALGNLSPIPFKNPQSPLANSPANLVMQNAEINLEDQDSFSSTAANAPLSRSNSIASSNSTSDPLSRSNSLASADSSSTDAGDSKAPSPVPVLDNANALSDPSFFEVDYASITPSSRAFGKRLYTSEDKAVVNVPTMKRFDALLLAPIRSNLFRHKRKVGSDEFRKNPEIVFEYFKDEMEPVVRELCRQDKSGEAFLAQRYFWCAYDLVRKRRANHIQYWRSYGRPKHLCYGGKELYEATYGKLKPIVRKRRSKRTVKQKLFKKRVKVDDNAENVRITDGNGENVRVNDGNGEDVRVNDIESDSEAFDPFSDKFSDELCEELLYETRNCKRCGCLFECNTVAFDPDDKDEQTLFCVPCLRREEMCKCKDCGKSLKRCHAFPQNSVEWNQCTTLRCGVCWGKHVKSMLPKIDKQQNGDGNKGKKKDEKNQGKGQARCKRCGSTSHKTARSRWCPFNAKYNKFISEGNFFQFPLPHIPGEGVGGYFNPLTAPPLITTGVEENTVIRRPATPPPNLKNDQGPDKAPPPIPNKVTSRAAKAPTVLKMAPLVDHEDVGNVKIPFTGAPPRKIPRKKASPAEVRCYTVGSNVFAMFGKNKWFLAHVTARDGVKHDVYFPGDSQELKGLTPERLRPCPASCTAPTRRQMIGKEFEYEGDDDIPQGTVWKISRVNTGNVFFCTKVSGGGGINCDDFDIGFVISTYQKQQERTREIGPKFSRR